MANYTPSTGNTPTGDAAAADVAADSATGTATSKSVDPKTESTETSTEEKRKPGTLWSAEPTIPEGEEVDEESAQRAQEENELRAKKPNEVVYRAADKAL